MEVLPHEKEIAELEKTLSSFRVQNQKNNIASPEELSHLEERLDKLKKNIYSKLSAWERVLICRHPDRPHTTDYLKNICDEFIELFGDRTFSNDYAVVGGFAKIGGRKFMVIGQEKGATTEERLRRNFGSVHPEGFRKSLRLVQLAEKFQLPVISFIDTGGAYPGLSAEERGQGRAIAWNLREFSRAATPIIVLIIGEGCSGGALGMGIGDRVAMLEHSYYSVISPEGCASIIWKDANRKMEAAEILKMQSEYLLQFGIIDTIIKEPSGGAHHNKPLIYERVKQFILEQETILGNIPLTCLVEDRYKKFRAMGSTTTQ